MNLRLHLLLNLHCTNDLCINLNLLLHMSCHLHMHLNKKRHILTMLFFRFGSVHGEELAYVLGMPLVGGTYHFVHNYTNQVNICFFVTIKNLRLLPGTIVV